MIKDNILKIKEKIEKSANKVGKSESDIMLVAVSKRFPEESILEAYNCGLKIFGENRVQEAVKKAEYFKNYNDIAFHIIGHLQTNKIKYLKNNFSLIHSIDRVELVDEFDKKLNHKQDVLIQVNIANEPQKSGIKIESLDELIERTLNSKFLYLKGLMLIPPNFEDKNETRKIFNKMYKCFENCKKKFDKFNNCSFDYLSMGMSSDFEIAIEEGSNMVRIGTAIFGQRPK